MKRQNRLSGLLESDIRKNNQTISKTKLIYGVFNDDVFMLSSLQKSKGNQELETKIEYLEYYTKGNVLRYKKEEGTITLIVRGYNSLYPILKIEGLEVNKVFDELSRESRGENQMSLYQLSNSCLNADVEEVTEENLGAKLRSVKEYYKNIYKAQDSYYAYDPLIAVTSIPPPNGQAVYYEYDGFCRLKSVKDEAGNKEQDLEYHYRS